ncbi:hypothetical protein BJ508DRAFT_332906 [Ascobolus immersus RN42]|uniref:CxC1-like cysteine cluster associated with KDZ transposases domain-containing protein n=1 Tax=Ascobolus immersus RN42 TaxID=1160509 RepID=A0A3N4HQ38_ASCIM|nr:hypothetical protein BJ508DRAFT_332906 [Ascobolus immersus RN42]
MGRTVRPILRKFGNARTGKVHRSSNFGFTYDHGRDKGTDRNEKQVDGETDTGGLRQFNFQDGYDPTLEPYDPLQPSPVRRRDRTQEYKERLFRDTREMAELLPVFAFAYAFDKRVCHCTAAQHHKVSIYCIGWKESGERMLTVCSCNAKLTHLMLQGYFPTEPTGVKTAFALDLLEFFRDSFHTSRASKDGFANALRMTNRRVLQKEVRDYCEHFRKCVYFFFRTVHMAGTMRADAIRKFGFGSEKAITFGSLAERCPACFYRVGCKGASNPWIVCIDGNFQHWRLLYASKYSIPPYLSQLFVDVPPVQRATIQATAVNTPATELCAHNFKAAGSKPMTMKKCDETGLMSVVCRHDCAVTMMNMYAGERFEWVLFALEHFLQMVELESGLRNECILLYDVACRLTPFVRTHKPDLAERLTVVVNKFHCYAHELKCQKLFGPTLRKGVGESDGEGTERVWGDINDLVASGRQSSAPNKQLQIEDRILFRAQQKRYGLAEILFNRYLRAHANLETERKRLALILDTTIYIECKDISGCSPDDEDLSDANEQPGLEGFKSIMREVLVTEEVLFSEFESQKVYFSNSKSRKVKANGKIYEALLLEKQLEEGSPDAEDPIEHARKVTVQGEVITKLLQQNKQSRADWKEGEALWVEAARDHHPERQAYYLIASERAYNAKRAKIPHDKFKKHMLVLRKRTDTHLEKIFQTRAQWKPTSRLWKKYDNEASVCLLEGLYAEILKQSAARSMELRNLKARGRGNKAAKRILAVIMRRFPSIEEKIREFNRIVLKLPVRSRPAVLTKAAFVPTANLDILPEEDGSEALWHLEIIRSDLFQPNNTVPDALWPHSAKIRYGIDSLHRRDRAMEEIEMEEVQGLHCIVKMSKKFMETFQDELFEVPMISELLQYARLQTDQRNEAVENDGMVQQGQEHPGRSDILEDEEETGGPKIEDQDDELPFGARDEQVNADALSLLEKYDDDDVYAFSDEEDDDYFF